LEVFFSSLAALLELIFWFVVFEYLSMFCTFRSTKFEKLSVCCCLAQLLHQAITTPILYDFYNYDVEKKEYTQLFLKFTQVRVFVAFDLFCHLGCISFFFFFFWGGGGVVFCFIPFPPNYLFSLLINFSFAVSVAEFGIVWGIAVLYRHEELNAEATNEEKGPQNQDTVKGNIL